jgi:isocitrate dehydrogenase
MRLESRTATGKWKKKVLINDRIADSIFQQVILRPEEYSILATTKPEWRLHFGCLRRRRWAGWGLRRAANIGDGYAVFEATHGTAPKYADKDVINPGSVMLSGVMLFEFLGWTEAAADRELAGEDDSAEVCDVRLRAADAGRDQGEDQRVCDAHD